MAKRDSVTVRLVRADAEVLLAALADGTTDANGETMPATQGRHRRFDEADIRALVRVWRHLRKSLRRLPFDWAETGGRVPRWARHR